MNNDRGWLIVGAGALVLWYLWRKRQPVLVLAPAPAGGGAPSGGTAPISSTASGCCGGNDAPPSAVSVAADAMGPQASTWALLFGNYRQGQPVAAKVAGVDVVATQTPIAPSSAVAVVPTWFTLVTT